jgi:hypothetical protein
MSVGRRDALIGTALLGLNPIYFILQFSFMTDVPFVALTVGATWAFVRGMRRRRTGWLAVAAVLASLACGVRVVGVVWPVTAVVALLVRGGGGGRRVGRIFLVGAPLLVMVGLWGWSQGHVVRPADISELPNSPGNRLRDLKEFGFSMLPRMSLAAIAAAVAVVGTGLLPLAAGIVNRGVVLRAVVVLGVLVLIVRFSPEAFGPLHSGATWSWRELGYVEVPNRPSYPPPGWLGCVLAGVAVGATAVLIASVRRAGTQTILVGQIVGQLLIVAVMWLFYDRFLLIVVPLMIAMIVGGRVIARPRVTIGLLVPLAVISFVGVRDHLAYSGAHSEALGRLRGMGARVDEIDMGYSTAAWVQYAHPENAPRDGARRVLVPSFTTDDVPRYQLSHVAISGTRVLGTVAFRRWLGPSGVIYLLEYPGRWNRRRVSGP